VKELPLPPELPLSIILSQHSRWEDIHPEWYRCPTSDSWSSIRQEDGHVDSELRKSMWQIRTATGNVEKVLRESLNFITLNFNEDIDREFCLQVKCLVINATNYDVLIGQKALFPPGFTIDNRSEHPYYRVD